MADDGNDGAHLADAAKLTGALIDVTKRFFGDQDTVDGRAVALGYVGALGAFLAQVGDDGDRLALVRQAARTLIEASDVALSVVPRFEPRDKDEAAERADNGRGTGRGRMLP